MNEDVLLQLIEGEGILLLERLGADRFQVLGLPPAWTSGLLHGRLQPGQEIQPEQVFSFLEHFLKEAEPVWTSNDPAGLTSEPWTETLANREELAFSASARVVAGRMFLMVRGLGVDFEERCRVLRKARELALAHERLLTETSEKETLLHCMVHDVAGPLAIVGNCFQMIESDPTLSDASRGLVQLGSSAARRQHVALKGILDLFAAELQSLDQFSDDPATAPEILDCAHSVLKSLRYSFEVKGVALELLLSPPSDRAWKVVGHRERLERILYNLLDNALRNAPAGSTVTLRVEDEGTAIRVSILDQGRKVDSDVVAVPFDPSLVGGAKWGRADLGLFFCRAMIRHWSGEMGLEPGPAGGGCLWFRLAKPASAG